MVATRPPTCKSTSPFNSSLVTVPNAQITIGIIVYYYYYYCFFLSFTFHLPFFLNSFLKFFIFFTLKKNNFLLLFLIHPRLLLLLNLHLLIINSTSVSFKKIFFPLLFPCLYGPVDWGCWIHRLHLCRGLRPTPNECPK